MKSLQLFICLIVLSTIVIAGAITPELQDKMNKNAKVKVIAFFKDRLTPQQAIQKYGVRGDELSQLKQVAQVYKQESNRQFFWISKLCKQRDAELNLENLVLNELTQSVTFTGTAKAIARIAKEPEIAKIDVYSIDKTKPDDFFLKPEYFKFNKVKIEYSRGEIDKPVRDVDVDVDEDTDIDVDQIINILKKLFEFIKENQPVVDTSNDQASAVPEGINGWQKLGGWREKHSGQYTIKYVNGFGITCVKIVVRAHFYHSGNYKGIGKYITCATSSIDELDVKWGYTLNATAKIPDSGIVNHGTEENPIAGMKMFINWQVKTILQNQQGTLTFSFDGEGNLSAY